MSGLWGGVVFSLRFRLALLIASIAGLALLGVGAAVLLQDRDAQAANALYQSEVQQTRLVEGISRRITLLDADIAAVAIGHKPPLDAHEYLRRNRPQIEKMLAQLRSHYDQVSGERRDMLDAIDYNQPDFHQLLEEINQAYLAGDVASVGELLRQRWPIMRYALIGPLDRLLYLQQTELDTTLAQMKRQGLILRQTLLTGLLLCLSVIGLIGWRMWAFLRGDLTRLQAALGHILDGHAPLAQTASSPEFNAQLEQIWHRIKNLQDFCLAHENRLALYKAALNTVPDGLCLLDRHGHLRYANTVSQSILQTGETPFSAASHWPELLEKARRQGEAHGSDEVLHDTQGQAHPVEIRLRYLPEHEADTPFVMFLHEIGETLRKSVELVQAYHSIKRLEDEVGAQRKELTENRQLAFLGRLASVMVTPAGSALAMMAHQLREIEQHPDQATEALPALHETVAELHRLLQGLDEHTATREKLPKETANGIE